MPQKPDPFFEIFGQKLFGKRADVRNFQVYTRNSLKSVQFSPIFAKDT